MSNEKIEALLKAYEEAEAAYDAVLAVTLREVSEWRLPRGARPRGRG